MSQPGAQPKLNSAKNAFEGPAVLILEDIDMWVSPYVDQQQQPTDELGGFLIASLSRGAREAMNLIHSAVNHPEVHILASMSSMSDIDPFFVDLLEPFAVVEIEQPDERERAEIWMEIAREHPSLRGINRDELVRYSANMPRFDIYMAAREAIEEAYHKSLECRKYVPVTATNVYEKLAAYHPLESTEYQLLEDEVVSELRNEFDALERFMNGEN
jgi:SpoVK/Ycf46/Vps4 family AAA+-type ATPase